MKEDDALKVSALPPVSMVQAILLLIGRKDDLFAATFEKAPRAMKTPRDALREMERGLTEKEEGPNVTPRAATEADVVGIDMAVVIESQSPALHRSGMQARSKQQYCYNF